MQYESLKLPFLITPEEEETRAEEYPAEDYPDMEEEDMDRGLDDEEGDYDEDYDDMADEGITRWDND